MSHTRRTMLTALPAAFLTSGALALKPEPLEAQAPRDTVLGPLAEEMRELARQSVTREIPSAEIARRSASGLRLLRSHLLASGLEARLHRHVRSPRMREAALAKAGQHLDSHDRWTELGLTPPPSAAREQLEAALNRWAVDPRALSRLLGEWATRMERLAPRLIGVAGAAGAPRLMPVQASGECDYLRAEAAYYDWIQNLACMFAMMNPELIPLCSILVSIYLMIQATMWAMGC